MEALRILLSQRNKKLSFKRFLGVATRWCEESNLAWVFGSKERLREVRKTGEGGPPRGGQAGKKKNSRDGSGVGGCLYKEILGTDPQYFFQTPLPLGATLLLIPPPA